MNIQADRGAALVNEEYAGFWRRVVAVFIDALLLVCITTPLLGWIYGWDYVLDESRSLVPRGAELIISYVLPSIATVIFWKTRQATPGKMLLSMKIVDAGTGSAMSTRQSIVRFFAYFVSTLPLLLGYLWIAFDPRKQSWHDKLAGTVVVICR